MNWLQRAGLAGVILVSAWIAPAYAIDPQDRLTDPALETRAREISAELRCLVCQNQSIDDSDAPLARDLRRIVRERIEAGDTNSAVIDFVVARYGEFILLRPRLGLHTILLWIAPIVLLGGGLAIAYFSLWGRREAETYRAPLTADEKKLLAEILKERR
jgi:cytochrome c-type biogenesis protein CcmH